MDGEGRIIRLDEPLPCGIYDGRATCGRPAKAALYEGEGPGAFRGKVARRYVVQLLGDDTDGWEDTVYLDDADRAARVARLEVATNPHVIAGRVIDAETGQVVVDVPEGGEQ